jgi:methylthioribose-1-phosphate isomerase
VRCDTAEAVADAIGAMVVRGAPAIGISAAYGMVLAAQAAQRAHGDGWADNLKEAFAVLGASRPTAVNLFWALDKMRDLIAAGMTPPAAARGKPGGGLRRAGE